MPLLKTHVWSIRNKDVSPETHLGGFLRVFEETEVFKDAFAQLDEGIKRQVKVFLHGGSEGQILAAGTQHDRAFALPPSPPAKRHFQELVEKVESFFHRDKKAQSINGHAVNGLVNGNMNGHAREIDGAVKPLSQVAPPEGAPKIFEDRSETKTMEVYGDKHFQN